jgi:hypothetical protein
VQGAGSSSTGSSSFAAHNLGLHCSSADHKWLRSSRCSRKSFAEAASNCIHQARQSTIGSAPKCTFGSSPSGASVPFVALASVPLTGRSQLSISINTVRQTSASPTLIRRQPVMATAAGGRGNAAHQPPIEELAQDAVVWATQHGLVRTKAHAELCSRFQSGSTCNLYLMHFT